MKKPGDVEVAFLHPHGGRSGPGAFILPVVVVKVAPTGASKLRFDEDHLRCCLDCLQQQFLPPFAGIEGLPLDDTDGCEHAT